MQLKMLVSQFFTYHLTVHSKSSGTAAQDWEHRYDAKF